MNSDIVTYIININYLQTGSFFVTKYNKLEEIKIINSAKNAKKIYSAQSDMVIIFLFTNKCIKLNINLTYVAGNYMNKFCTKLWLKAIFPVFRAQTMGTDFSILK